MGVILDHVVPARTPWSRVIRRGETLTIVDLEGQQAVDFLCYRADDLEDRYSSMNTVKVQGGIYIGLGTVLYADSGVRLMTVTADSLGRHDTIYGCCSEANNFLRYGVRDTHNCYANFLAALQPAAAVAADVSTPGSSVTLRADTDTLAVISNCPQIHNPCNGYNPSPIRVIVKSAP